MHISDTQHHSDGRTGLISRFASQRPRVSPLTLNVVVITFILLAYNQSFWATSYSLFKGDMGVLVPFSAAVWVRLLFFVSLFGFYRLQRPVLAAFILIGSQASFFLDNLGVFIDREMIQNVFATNVHEAGQLLSWQMIWQTLLWGILPAALVFWPHVERGSLIRETIKWPIISASCFALMAGLLLIDYKTISSVYRQNHVLKASFLPEAPIKAAVKYVRMITESANIEVRQIGLDAQKGALLASADKPVLTVVFVGETVRAQNWGLNGYKRDTTPELAGRADLINFSDVSSCGTSTSVSVPCMFSTYSKDEYSHTKHRGTENLLDVFNHAGIKTIWLDNNSHDQGVAVRTGSKRLEAADDPEACASGECYDTIFLPLIRETVDTMTEDTVLVLHMIGSHGPAYFRRYPEEYRAFTPACASLDFSECTVEEVTNSYDNTIRMSDHVLAQSLDILSAQDRVISSVVYVSDHGESLGEGGVYLHAAPMFMAPETQTKVPMVMWMSESFKSLMHLDSNCLENVARTAVSQDNLFDTLLGMMNVETKERDAGLDLVSGCRVSS